MVKKKADKYTEFIEVIIHVTIQESRIQPCVSSGILWFAAFPTAQQTIDFLYTSHHISRLTWPTAFVSFFRQFLKRNLEIFLAGVFVIISKLFKAGVPLRAPRCGLRPRDSAQINVTKWYRCKQAGELKMFKLMELYLRFVCAFFNGANFVCHKLWPREKCDFDARAIF